MIFLKPGLALVEAGRTVTHLEGQSLEAFKRFRVIACAKEPCKFTEGIASGHHVELVFSITQKRGSILIFHFG